MITAKIKVKKQKPELVGPGEAYLCTISNEDLEVDIGGVGRTKFEAVINASKFWLEFCEKNGIGDCTWQNERIV
jgi:hypothetical protein